MGKKWWENLYLAGATRIWKLESLKTEGFVRFLALLVRKGTEKMLVRIYVGKKKLLVRKDVGKKRYR